MNYLSYEIPWMEMLLLFFGQVRQKKDKSVVMSWALIGPVLNVMFLDMQESCSFCMNDGLVHM